MADAPEKNASTQQERSKKAPIPVENLPFLPVDAALHGMCLKSPASTQQTQAGCLPCLESPFAAQGFPPPTPKGGNPPPRGFTR